MSDKSVDALALTVRRALYFGDGQGWSLSPRHTTLWDRAIAALDALLAELAALREWTDRVSAESARAETASALSAAEAAALRLENERLRRDILRMMGHPGSDRRVMEIGHAALAPEPPVVAAELTKGHP